MPELNEQIDIPEAGEQADYVRVTRYSDDFTTLLEYGETDARYEVDSRCTSIAAHAFENALPLTEVILPEGLETIGEAAFKGCRNLNTADFPSTLARIDDEAFFGTALKSIHIPAGLTHIGTNALVTCSDVPGGIGTKTRTITVDDANPVYALQPGLLVERLDDGGYRALTHFGEMPDFTLGPDIREVAPYALNGAPDIRHLHITDRIEKIGDCGLAIHGPIKSFEIALSEPLAGHDSIAYTYPHYEESQRDILRILRQGTVDVETVVETYDKMLISEVFDADRSLRILERLTDPYLMSARTNEKFNRLIRTRFTAICDGFTEQNNQAGFEMLAEMGYINADNISEVIDRVSHADNVALTGYLLEMQHRRFSSFDDDFEL